MNAIVKEALISLTRTANPAPGMSANNLLNALIELIAQVTRYPREILDPDANLENDLGIDSVKRGEIVVAMRREFNLPDDLHFPEEAFQTIRSAANALGQAGAMAGSPPPANLDDKAAPRDLLSELTALVAEVTRYPAEILLPDSDFENELGIDSVKRGEILVAVRKHFGLADDFEVHPDAFRTLASAAQMLAGANVHPSAASMAKIPAPASRPVLAVVATEPVIQRLRRVIADVTRYPEELLLPTADFEDDLGIDSVKRGEILIAVRSEFGLADDADMPPESFKSLESAAGVLESLQFAAAAVIPEQEVLAPRASNASSPPRHADPSNKPTYMRELTDLFAANDLRPFAGKIAFVTGSGHGIGKETARSLARLGATVVVNAFHSREEGEQTTAQINREGGTAHFVWGSVANPEHRAEMFKRIEEIGGLDFFISNASNGFIGPFDDITDEHWTKGCQTIVVGLHQCAVLAAPLMARRGGGKIITISTPASQRHVNDFACMGALKAAVESLTRSLAVEFEKYRVSVNCISAGPVYGDLIKQFPDSDNTIRYWEERSLDKRLVYPQEICNFINFLLSGAADSINGSVLVMDCGLTLRV